MKKFLSVFFLSLMVLVLAACSEDTSKDVDKANPISGVDALKQAEDAYLVFFHMPSCVHCQAFKPVLKEYTEKEGSLKVYAVNLEIPTEKSSWNRYNIEGTPTTVLVETVNGKKEITQVLAGGVPLEDIPTKADLGKAEVSPIEETVKPNEELDMTTQEEAAELTEVEVNTTEVEEKVEEKVVE